MLVAKQLGKHASINFIFGILHIYVFFFFCYLCHGVIGKNFVHTLGIHIIILACFHMYIHIGIRVHIHICVCELCTCIITFTPVRARKT